MESWDSIQTEAVGEGSPGTDPAKVTVHIHSLTGNKVQVDVRGDDTVLTLKQLYRDSFGCAIPYQKLIFGHKELTNDGATIQSCGITDGSKVFVIFRNFRRDPE